MVTSVTNLSRNGLSDWLIQRVSAIAMFVYVVYLVIYLLCNPHITFATWHHLFSCVFMQIATLLILLLVLAHAWIGLWIVFTDYVKCPCIRLPLQICVSLLLIGYLIWGAMILWS